MQLKLIAVASPLALLLLAAPRAAHALETAVSFDVDYAAPVSSQTIGSGAGGQLRFGPRLSLPLLTLDAEVGLGVHALTGADGPTAFRGVIGPRIGLDLLLRPSVFAHLGVGHVERSVAADLTNVTADVGVALDIRLAPIVDLGAQAAYNSIFSNGDVSGLDFYVIGGHLTFFFERRQDKKD